MRRDCHIALFFLADDFLANCIHWDNWPAVCGIKFNEEDLTKYFGGVPPDFYRMHDLRTKYSQYDPFPIVALISIGVAIIAYWMLLATAERRAETDGEFRLHVPDPGNPLGLVVWIFGLGAIAFNIVTVIYTANWTIALNESVDPRAQTEVGGIALASASLAVTIIFFLMMINGLRVETVRYKAVKKPEEKKEAKKCGCDRCKGATILIQGGGC